MNRVDEKTFPIVKLPNIPERQVCVTSYGAKEGMDFCNTKAFHDAMLDVSNQGGGTVVVPAGIWYTGPIRLRSHVELHLERGAFVVFRYNQEEFPLIKTNFEGTERIRATSPIYAIEEENIAITGEGIFDGCGDSWRPVKKSKLTDSQWNQLIKSGVHERGMWFPSKSSFDGHYNPDIKPSEPDALTRAEEYYDYYRPVMVSLVNCTKIKLEGVTFQNSPAWNLHPLFCEHITIQNVTVRNPWYAQNGDGIDLESCRYVNILNSSFDVGDDAICLKSGKNEEARKIKRPTEYVTIKGCTVYHGHGGLVVGSEMSRGVNHVVLENCTFIGTDIGVRFKSTLGRGGVVEDIRLSNIRMTNIAKEAVLFSMLYSGAMDETNIKEEDIPEFKNIYLDHIQCDGAGVALGVYGLKQLPIHDIILEECNLRANYGVKSEYAKNILLKNVKVTAINEQKEIYYDEVDIA